MEIQALGYVGVHANSVEAPSEFFVEYRWGGRWLDMERWPKPASAIRCR